MALMYARRIRSEGALEMTLKERRPTMNFMTRSSIAAAMLDHLWRGGIIPGIPLYMLVLKVYRT